MKPIATRGKMFSTGVVSFLSTERAFAFVTPDGGRDIFVHLSRVAVEQRAALDVGQPVEFGQAETGAVGMLGPLPGRVRRLTFSSRWDLRFRRTSEARGDMNLDTLRSEVLALLQPEPTTPSPCHGARRIDHPFRRHRTIRDVVA
jgi:cold shock CspA family protein